ncbi:MAG: PEGA domain-containing protein [Candidatus Gottesmanbacteria bacterium]|nr:PEGA domain-containing protein [Candidatus Gottesmanbacteria bacterium]
MKRKIVFILVLVGLVGAVALVVKLLTNRGPKQGELRVNSNPGAAIFLDNKNIGRTPFPSEKINAGSYTIKLVPDSATTQFASWEGQIVIGQGLLTYVNADLTESELSSAVDVLWLEKISSKQSELSVTTNPDGASVLVDDVTRGVTPISISNITPADHTVTVTSVGFLTRTLKIRTTPGYRLIATMKLGLSSGEQIPEASPTPTLAPSGKVTPTPKTATSSAQINPEKPYLVVKDTPTGFLRVRMEPGTNATESARVNPGDKFTILDTQIVSATNWYQIRYDATNTGWVSGTYVDKVE